MKNLSALCILLLVTTMGFGQIKVQLGIRLGLNFSNISNTDFNAKNGINATAFVEIRF